MNNRILMLQPLIEYGTKEYQETEVLNLYKTIIYDCFAQKQPEFVPDGCFELIFMWSPNLVECVKLCKNTHIVLPYQEVHLHGIRVSPGYWIEIGNEEIEFMKKELARIYNREDRNLYIEERIGRYIKKREMHPAVSIMIDEIMQSNGKITVEKMAEVLGYSERHINNLFKEVFEFGPKNFCQYIRFQHSLFEMLKDPYRNNSQFIEKLSYSDQAHFQREFKIYMGLTPKQFIARYLMH